MPDALHMVRAVECANSRSACPARSCRRAIPFVVMSIGLAQDPEATPRSHWKTSSSMAPTNSSPIQALAERAPHTCLTGADALVATPSDATAYREGDR